MDAALLLYRALPEAVDRRAKLRRQLLLEVRQQRLLAAVLDQEGAARERVQQVPDQHAVVVLQPVERARAVARRAALRVVQRRHERVLRQSMNAVV